jgi:hypothetical protein
MRIGVGQGDIVALVEEGFPGRPGERVGKTVAEVQARLVAALPKSRKAWRARSPCSRVAYSTTQARRRKVGLAGAVRAELALDHHRELDVVGDADPADVGVVGPFDEGLRLHLAVAAIVSGEERIDGAEIEGKRAALALIGEPV